MGLAFFTRPRRQALLTVLATLAFWAWQGGPVTATVAGLAAALALLACASPQRHAPVQRALDRFVRGFAQGFSWLVLGLIFAGVFTPLRFLRALTARRPPPPVSDSYLHPLPPASARNFDRQF